MRRAVAALTFTSMSVAPLCQTLAQAPQAGGPTVLAWPMDGATGTVRRGSRFKQVLLVRLRTARLTAARQGFANDGVVAFSAICTHAGCVVSGW